MSGGSGEGSGGDREGEGRKGGGFADALSDVKPLEGRQKLRPPPQASASPPSPAPDVRFEIERGGDSVRGRADGVSRATLAKLQRGRFEIDAEIDLHGLHADAARRGLAEQLAAVWDEGGRCALVIHGRGQHSAAEPVLKRQLPDWLTAPPLAAHVLAFSPAPTRLGGAGATLVLLRRPGR